MEKSPVASSSMMEDSPKSKETATPRLIGVTAGINQLAHSSFFLTTNRHRYLYRDTAAGLSWNQATIFLRNLLTIFPFNENNICYLKDLFLYGSLTSGPVSPQFDIVDEERF